LLVIKNHFIVILSVLMDILQPLIMLVLFPEHSVPVPCPKALHSDLDFSYDRGDGTCTSEDSKIKKCASEKSFHIQMGDCGSYGYSGEGRP